MALINIFKKKEEEKAPEKKPEALKPAVKKAIKKETALKPETQKIRKKYIPDHEVLRAPHITEKATDANDLNKYILKVGPKANKIEVKKAIESTYGVDVTAVNIINIHSKQRRVGRNIGWSKGYKKAIVTIKEGQKIEIMPR